MKKLFTLTATALLTLSLLTGCGGNTAPTPDGGNENGLTTVTPGKLTVATSPDYAPYEFYALDEAGNPTLAGFDMALAQYIADELELELEVVPMSFNGILGEMAAGTADLAIAGLSPDPDREEAMEFSDVYYEGKQGFLTLESKLDQFGSLADTNDPAFSIGVQTGAIQAELAQQFSPDADIVSLTKVTDIIAELVSEKLDGAYVEYDVAEAYKANYPQLAILCEVPYEAEGNIIGVQKGNAALLESVNQALNKCVSEGTFAQYVAQALEQAAGATASYVDGEIVPDGE